MVQEKLMKLGGYETRASNRNCVLVLRHKKRDSWLHLKQYLTLCQTVLDEGPARAVAAGERGKVKMPSTFSRDDDDDDDLIFFSLPTSSSLDFQASTACVSACVCPLPSLPFPLSLSLPLRLFFPRESLSLFPFSSPLTFFAESGRLLSSPPLSPANGTPPSRSPFPKKHFFFLRPSPNSSTPSSLAVAREVTSGGGEGGCARIFPLPPPVTGEIVVRDEMMAKEGGRVLREGRRTNMFSAGVA